MATECGKSTPPPLLPFSQPPIPVALEKPQDSPEPYYMEHYHGQPWGIILQYLLRISATPHKCVWVCICVYSTWMARGKQACKFHRWNAAITMLLSVSISIPSVTHNSLTDCSVCKHSVHTIVLSPGGESGLWKYTRLFIGAKLDLFNELWQKYSWLADWLRAKRWVESGNERGECKMDRKHQRIR